MAETVLAVRNVAAANRAAAGQRFAQGTVKCGMGEKRVNRKPPCLRDIILAVTLAYPLRGVSIVIVIVAVSIVRQAVGW